MAAPARAACARPCEARAQAWIRRRQGPDADPVRLDRRRIYILPTPLGIAYAAMLFAMVLGGMNYGNNLGLGARLPAGESRPRGHAPLPRHAVGPRAAAVAHRVRPSPASAVAFRLLLENTARAATAAHRARHRTRARLRACDVPAAGSARGRRCALPAAATRPRAARALRGRDAASARPVPGVGGRSRRATTRSPGRRRPSAAARRPASRPTPAAHRTARRATTISPGCGRTSPATRCGASPGRPTRAARACTPSSTPAPTSSRTSSTGTACPRSAPRRGCRSCAAGCSTRTSAARRSACGCRACAIEPNVGTAHRERCLNALALFEDGHGRA